MSVPGFDRADVPDGVCFDQVRVYRQWILAPGAHTLTGLVQWDPPWLPDWNTACCLAQDPPEAYDHTGGTAGCSCGFWGYWLPSATRITYPFGPCRLFGVCEVAGSIRIGELGVRAEKARILAVVAIHDAADVVRARYRDVAVYDDPGRLIEDYPPVDTVPLLGQDAETAFREYFGQEAGAALTPSVAQSLQQLRQTIARAAAGQARAQAAPAQIPYKPASTGVPSWARTRRRSPIASLWRRDQ